MIDTPQSVDLIVRAGTVVTMNPSRHILMDGAVAISGNTIVAVDKAEKLMTQFSAAREITVSKGLLTPGLIDAHNHPQDYILKGVLDDVGKGLVRMSTYVFPFEHDISDDEAFISAQGTFADMLRHGTTCFCDAGGPTPDGIANAAKATGIRGVIARRCNDLPGFMKCPVDGDVDEIVERADKTIERWNGTAGGRLRAAYNLDLPNNVSDDLCTKILGHAAERNVGIVGHLVGRLHSTDPARNNRNPDVERYERLGLLGPQLSCAHIGWMHPLDVKAFARADAKAVHCPSQSMFGGTGVISHGVIPELIEAGVTVGLGTDAACISRFLDLLRVMYLAACSHKDARMDPLIVGAHKAMEMATIDGARVLMWDAQIGSLEPGKKADIVIFDTDGFDWSPSRLSNPVGTLVYTANGQCTHTVIVDGQVVVEDGRLKTVDVKALEREMDQLRPKIFQRLGFDIPSRWPVL